MNSAISSLNQLLIVMAAVLPLSLSLCYAVRKWDTALAKLAPWSAVPAIMASIIGPVDGQVELSWFLLEMRLGIDSVACTFLFFTAVLWFLSAIYGQRYLAQDPFRSRFFFYYLLAMGGNFGLIVAQDMITFYVFFALMSFSSYGLVVHNRDKDALSAGKIYIILVVFGEILLFTALTLTASKTGSTDLTTVASMPVNNLIILLVLIGFGIKAGALPLHVWLPLAHPAAPTPASAVLSGAMIKAGLFGWLRFLPWGLPATAGWGATCIVAGMLAAFFGVIIGLNQKNPKTLLAYSSISQMGLITIGVGLGLSLPNAVPVALAAVSVYAVHHGFAKGALFLSVGIASSSPKHFWMRVLMMGGTALAALALAGAPLTSGMFAKTGLKSVVNLLAGPWSEWLNILLPLASTGTSLLMIRFLWLVQPKKSGDHDGSIGLLLPWMLMLIFVAVATWKLPETQAAVSKALYPTTLWVAMWPVALGICLSGIVYYYLRKRNRKIHQIIPAGDIVVLIHRLPYEQTFKWMTKMHQFLGSQRSQFDGLKRHVSSKFVQRDLLNHFEQQLTRWPIAGILFACIICVFLFMLVGS